jgi:hypothetical protein
VYTNDELNQWNNNKNINPKTNRKIKDNGPTWTIIQNQYNLKIIQTPEQLNKVSTDDKKEKALVDDSDEEGFILLNKDWDFSDYENLIREYVGVLYDTNINELEEELDIISQEYIITSDKKLNVPIYYVISYKDDNDKIICFMLSSIYEMYINNIKTHPITNKKIPDDVFNRSTKLKELLEKNKIITCTEVKQTVKQRTLTTFQKFTFISLYLDEDWFIKLNRLQLIKIVNEIYQVFINSMSLTVRQQIYASGIFFDKKENELQKLSQVDLQNYVLDEMNKVLDCPNEVKIIACYTLIGGMSWVIKDITKRYPDITLN